MHATASHNAFPKAQRLCNRIRIERLFLPGNSRSFAAFPIRMVIRTQPGEQSQLLISVPKRCFKHAVDRNRVKRQIREAYRLQRDKLTLPDGQCADIAMLWLDAHHHPTAVVMSKVANLLTRASEALRPKALTDI